MNSSLTPGSAGCVERGLACLRRSAQLPRLSGWVACGGEMAVMCPPVCPPPGPRAAVTRQVSAIVDRVRQCRGRAACSQDASYDQRPEVPGRASRVARRCRSRRVRPADTDAERAPTCRYAGIRMQSATAAVPERAISGSCRTSKTHRGKAGAARWTSGDHGHSAEALRRRSRSVGGCCPRTRRPGRRCRVVSLGSC